MAAVGLLAGAAVAAADVTPAGPASLGQQPTSAAVPAGDATPSQANTHQFDQLFQLENTPDTCAAGEGFITGRFEYLDHDPGSAGIGNGYRAPGQQYRFDVQGQYGATDQIAFGGFVPVVVNSDNGYGFGDVGIYGQYKFDRLITRRLFDLTAQLDLITPTGNAGRLRDTGHIGVRPLALAYKDFGDLGPGRLGAYGLLGFNLAPHPDFRIGAAATYEFAGHVAAALEVTDTEASGPNQTLAFVTPGVLYRGLRGFELAAGVPIGLGHESPDFGINLRATYAFPK